MNTINNNDKDKFFNNFKKNEKTEANSKSEEKRLKISKKEKDHAPLASKEEATILSIINDNAPISMKKISQKANVSMSKCAIIINNLIKNKTLDKQDVIDAPK